MYGELMWKTEMEYKTFPWLLEVTTGKVKEHKWELCTDTASSVTGQLVKNLLSAINLKEHGFDFINWIYAV
jgi:hypothetical protein